MPKASWSATAGGAARIVSTRGAQVSDQGPIAGYCDGDVDTNRSGNPHLNDMIAARYSRRETLSGVAAAVTAVFCSGMVAACGGGGGGGGTQGAGVTTVSAGQNGQSRSGKSVRLTGTVSGASAGIIGWQQISGPAVTFTNVAGGEATFIAPAVAAPTTLVFRFSARDAAGTVLTADTTILIDVAILDFTPVPKSLNDLVSVPAGYSVAILYRTGDPIGAGLAAYVNNGSDGNFAQRAGDHHDGMAYYGLDAAGAGRLDTSSDRALLAVNHENISQAFLHPAGPTGSPRPEAEALKEIEAHGVSIVEIVRAPAGGWSYTQGATFNRRVTPNTPVALSGPLRGNPRMRTAYSTDGTQGRGTIANCALGATLWGTYLTCEENWAGYFGRSAADNGVRSARDVTALNRYGIFAGAPGNYGWTSVLPASGTDTSYRRWNASVVSTALPPDGSGDFRNEANQFGWVVEIDPYDPAKMPRKRTALGRFAHEGAWRGQWTAGRRIALYMGDDGRGEYLYKYVSGVAWDPADAQALDRLAIGDKYLDSGTLYVARFASDGTGAWLPLVFGLGGLTPASPVFPFQDQADVLLHARLAADALGATRMDRPEWTASHPVTGEIYVSLTNNDAGSRPLNGTDAANPRHYNDQRGATAQYGNPNGHILRLREANDNGEALTFIWDIYVFGAGADLDPANVNLSALDATNDFSSPDGLGFSRPTNPAGQVNPLLWIRSDDAAYTDVTNNQMLAALPGHTADGGPRTIVNVGQSGSATQATFVGRAPGVALKRFLVGPQGAEITGLDTTPDGRSLFVNIQHPTANWPQSQTGGTGRPRSATIVITKDDGGVVGL